MVGHWPSNLGQVGLGSAGWAKWVIRSCLKGGDERCQKFNPGRRYSPADREEYLPRSIAGRKTHMFPLAQPCCCYSVLGKILVPFPNICRRCFFFANPTAKTVKTKVEGVLPECGLWPSGILSRWYSKYVLRSALSFLNWHGGKEWVICSLRSRLLQKSNPQDLCRGTIWLGEWGPTERI